jgi:hypothetical protein
MSNHVPLLPLEDMAARHAGLTQPLAGSLHEAARVCLDRHHQSPTDFKVSDDGVESRTRIEWDIADARVRAAWANEIDTTEFGAYACALASTELLKGLFAVRRADTLTGADYYLAPAGTRLDDLESCLRLEVSGTDRGTAHDVEVRLLEKLDQARKGKSNLPALASVVGFKAKKISMKPVAPVS